MGREVFVKRSLWPDDPVSNEDVVGWRYKITDIKLPPRSGKNKNNPPQIELNDDLAMMFYIDSPHITVIS